MERGQVAIESFEQLEVWKAAHKLVLGVYEVCSRMPSDQRFGLISQMHRAAVSVPANIAEGFKRRSARDKARCCNVAQRSLEETRYYLILCRDLGYPANYGEVAAQVDPIGRMLTALIRSVRG